MEEAQGVVTAYDERGYTVFVPYHNVERALLRECEKVTVWIHDGRDITADQRRKAFALMGEISRWNGDGLAELRQELYSEFMIVTPDWWTEKAFSLSNCTVTEARAFISFLIEFMIEWNVPSRWPLIGLCEDIQHYVYACAMNRKCAVCGKERADLHHVDKIGMGGDRTRVKHVGRRAVTLCREHHGEVEQTGDAAFFAKYHLEPIVLDEKLVKTLKLVGIGA